MKSEYQSYYKQLGLNIAYYRKLQGLTQLDLAEFTDLSRTHISNIEAPNMKTHISLDTLFSIADVLRIPANFLISAYMKKPPEVRPKQPATARVPLNISIPDPWKNL